jgi:hypothetical protein
MTVVGAFEAKNKLGCLLDLVEQARKSRSRGAAKTSPGLFLLGRGGGRISFTPRSGASATARKRSS